MQDWRQHGLAVAVVEQAVELRVQEDREAAHLQQALCVSREGHPNFFDLQDVGGGVVLVLGEDVTCVEIGQRAAPPDGVLV